MPHLFSPVENQYHYVQLRVFQRAAMGAGEGCGSVGLWVSVPVVRRTPVAPVAGPRRPCLPRQSPAGRHRGWAGVVATDRPGGGAAQCGVRRIARPQCTRARRSLSRRAFRARVVASSGPSPHVDGALLRRILGGSFSRGLPYWRRFHANRNSRWCVLEQASGRRRRCPDERRRLRPRLQTHPG